ncbi:hypothetical protein [Streptacidiphilus monticola]|uniref:Uncharacterized protein n=1 Tax=Streptacidiphilus monticola TaxID=2161674 RepID=A0ABW1G7L3_9ACTN
MDSTYIALTVDHSGDTARVLAFCPTAGPQAVREVESWAHIEDLKREFCCDSCWESEYDLEEAENLLFA